MMTGREYFFCSWCYSSKQERCVSLWFHFLVFVVNQEKMGEGVFRTLSSICDGNFLAKVFSDFKPLTIFSKRLHR